MLVISNKHVLSVFPILITTSDLSLLDRIFPLLANCGVFNCLVGRRNDLFALHYILRVHLQGARSCERKQTPPLWGGVLGFDSDLEYHHYLCVISALKLFLPA